MATGPAISQLLRQCSICSFDTAVVRLKLVCILLNRNLHTAAVIFPATKPVCFLSVPSTWYPSAKIHTLQFPQCFVDMCAGACFPHSCGALQLVHNYIADSPAQWCFDSS